MKDSIPISEIFYSLQGEGPQIGVPTTFVRVFACNMKPHCKWCDTPYAIRKCDDTVHNKTLEDLFDSIRNINCTDITFTGGEPFLYWEEIQFVIKKLVNEDQDYNFHFETNGLIFPEGFEKFNYSIELDTWITYNISPKLHALSESYRKSLTKWALALQGIEGRFKFVYENKETIKVIKQLASEINLDDEFISLMPEGIHFSQEMYKECAEQCLEEGWIMSPRLQNIIWDNKRGV